MRSNEMTCKGVCNPVTASKGVATKKAEQRQEYASYPKLLYFPKYLEKQLPEVGLKIAWYKFYGYGSRVIVPLKGKKKIEFSDRRSRRKFKSTGCSTEPFFHLKHPSIIAGDAGGLMDGLVPIYLKSDKLEYESVLKMMVKKYVDYLSRYKKMYGKFLNEEDARRLKEYKSKKYEVVILKPVVLDQIEL